jgi:hypothetical protein
LERIGLMIRHVWHRAGMAPVSEKEPLAACSSASSYCLRAFGPLSMRPGETVCARKYVTCIISALAAHAQCCSCEPTAG